MPIRAANRARYPKDWKTIRAAILRRAGNACEAEGCTARNGEPHPITGSVVVLTIAHLDHVPEHVEESNLRAWCQRCHLRYDAVHHRRNAAATRRAKLGTGELFAEADDVRQQVDVGALG